MVVMIFMATFINTIQKFVWSACEIFCRHKFDRLYLLAASAAADDVWENLDFI